MNGRFLLWVFGVLLAMDIGATSQEPSQEQPHAYAHFLQYRDSPGGRSWGAAGVAPSILLYAPDPEYTRAARQARVKGTVVLVGQFGVNGCLQEIKIIRSLGYGLDESAMYAVQRWRSKPFQENGKPAVKNVQIELNFDPLFSPDDADLPTNKMRRQSIRCPSE